MTVSPADTVRWFARERCMGFDRHVARPEGVMFCVMVARLTVLRTLVVAVIAAVLCVGLVKLVSAAKPSAPSGPEPVDLSSDKEHAREPRIAVDARGTAIAVWHQWRGRDSIVQSAVRPAGGAWQAPTDLSAVGQQAENVQLAVDRHGTAVAVWDRLRDGNYVVQAAVRPAGGSWGAVADLSAAGRSCRLGHGCRSTLRQRVSRFLLPSVAVDQHGNAVAIWERFQGRSSRVQSAFKPAGGRWRAPVDVVRFGRTRLTDFASPQIALGPRGQAIAVWTRRRAASLVVQAAERRARGHWRSPVNLSGLGSWGGGARIAVDARGHAHAVWQSAPLRVSDETIVQGATRAANGAWTRPMRISAARALASGPVLAVNQRGVAVVAWTRFAGQVSSVQSSIRVAGKGWNAPVDLSVAKSGTSYGGPDVAVNSRGNAVAAWRVTLPNPNDDDEEPPVALQGAVRPAGASWQPRSLRGADDVQGNVRAGIDPRGDLVALWLRRSPGGHNVVRATGP